MRPTVKYAVQACDKFSNQNQKRYCGDDRLLLCKKSITSLLSSIENSLDEHQNHGPLHVVRIFNDRSSYEYTQFMAAAVRRFSSMNLIVEVVNTKKPGIMQSIRECYEWLIEGASALVYQVQDDYLFRHDAIYQMIDIFRQVKFAVNTEPVISSYNDPWLFLNSDSYAYRPTPRTIIPGARQYWLQYYDMSCSFMTSPKVIKDNYDLIEKFLSLPPNGDDQKRLESISLNYMLTRRGVLGLMPFSSVGLHMQAETEKDPYIDWKSWWDSVEEI